MTSALATFGSPGRRRPSGKFRVRINVIPKARYPKAMLRALRILPPNPEDIVDGGKVTSEKLI
jgi:hypothetical protein